MTRVTAVHLLWDQQVVSQPHDIRSVVLGRCLRAWPSDVVGLLAEYAPDGELRDEAKGWDGMIVDTEQGRFKVLVATERLCGDQRGMILHHHDHYVQLGPGRVGASQLVRRLSQAQLVSMSWCVPREQQQQQDADWCFSVLLVVDGSAPFYLDIYGNNLAFQHGVRLCRPHQAEDCRLI